MKTFVKTLALAALVAANSFNASANETKPEAKKTFTVSTYQSVKDGSLHVAVDKALGSKIRIVLTDETGNLLFSQNLTKTDNGQRWKFDLNELKDGTYRLRITDGNNSEVKNFQIKTEEVSKASRFVAVN
jgi:hypothetical protein